MEKTRENPYPFAEGTGFARVQIYVPGPVPQGPLPVTLAGFETRGIPYLGAARWRWNWTSSTGDVEGDEGLHVVSV